MLVGAPAACRTLRVLNTGECYCCCLGVQGWVRVAVEFSIRT